MVVDCFIRVVILLIFMSLPAYLQEILDEDSKIREYNQFISSQRAIDTKIDEFNGELGIEDALRIKSALEAFELYKDRLQEQSVHV